MIAGAGPKQTRKKWDKNHEGGNKKLKDVLLHKDETASL